ncbi:TPA: hypothetical protein SK286_000976 [Yersinia enterocolitica]|nr:hypothetical protein [Yersinia enterocolitica]
MSQENTFIPANYHTYSKQKQRAIAVNAAIEIAKAAAGASTNASNQYVDTVLADASKGINILANAIQESLDNVDE